VSHLVQIKTQLRDANALAAACTRLGLGAPVAGTAQLFSGRATGLLVRLPGWEYPVVVDTASGEVRYDNYEGRWGQPAELDKLLQAYAVEKARIEARKAGHAVAETTLADGSIRLTIGVGGAL
jgi:hypothetical protein